jgi:hypothetical protein
MVRKLTVNITLAKGHHRHTARNSQNVHTVTVHHIFLYIITFVSGEDEYNQNRFPAIQYFSAILSQFSVLRLHVNAFLNDFNSSFSAFLK